MAIFKKDELLQSLRFDKKLTNSYISKYLTNPRLVILLLTFIIALGVNAFITLPRELNPKINIPIVLVSTILPGANPADIESLVTVPIEDSIDSVEGVKTVTSSSQDNASIITIEFDSGIDPEKAKADVQSAVDSVSNLPEDTLDPKVIKLDFENSPVWTFTLTTKNDPASLFKFSQTLKDKLEGLAEVDNIQINGLEQTEIEITVSPQTYSTYEINPFTLSQLIVNALRSFPAGNVKTQNNTFSLAIDPQAVTIDDLRNLRVSLGGQNVALSDIATISEHPIPDQSESYLAKKGQDLQRSVTFNVFKTKNTNINAAVNAAEQKAEEEIAREKDGHFEILTIVDTAEEIDTQFFELARDFLITVILVVLVLFIFLGPKQALISALSAPLSFLITFIVMQATGITLNFLSLFSLILSLGLLVDDTVVIISAMSMYYKTKRFTPLETGLLVWRDFLIPVFTTTITTVWAFVPLLLSTGIIGEFIKSIPIVVSTALIASFIVGMFITLPLMVFLLKPNFPKRISVLIKYILFGLILGITISLLPKGQYFVIQVGSLLLVLGLSFLLRTELKQIVKSKSSSLFFQNPQKKSRSSKPRSYLQAVLSRNYSEGLISFDSLNSRYKKLIFEILSQKHKRKKVIWMVIILSVFSFALVPLGFVKNEFFPKVDSEIIYATVEFPPGTYIGQTKEAALAILPNVVRTPGVEFASLDLGQTLNLEGSSPTQGGNSNNALFSINLEKENSSVVATELRKKFKNYQKGKLSVIEVSGGPPAGADLQIKLSGEDLGTLNAKADEIISYLNSQSGVANIDKSQKPGTSKLTFVPDKAALVENNISIDQIGLWLRLYSSGFVSDTNKFPGDDEDKDIILRVFSTSSTVQGIEQTIIPTQQGIVPLSSLGKIKLGTNPTLIAREEGNRVISVSATVTKGFDLATINSNLEKFVNTKLNLSDGYSWKTGGVNEENENSVQSILSAMLLSFMLIIVTMVVQFSSFRRALIVMLVIPLSISGVFIVFALTKTPLSFPALIGVLALFGIVVKNSILLVDKIVSNIKKEMHLKEAIADASASRLEPIALTSFATILGLTPITLTDPLWRGLGGAIIAGLIFSGAIMLLFIPVAYYQIYKNSEA